MSLSMIKLALNQRVGSAISRTVLKPTCRVNKFRQCRFSSNEKLGWESSCQAVLSKNLETALKSRQVDEAWESFWDFKTLYGLPQDSLVVHRLITELLCSCEPLWLQKACRLVSLLLEEKPRWLNREILAKLCLSLARLQLTDKAMKILGLMFARDMLPPMNVFRLVVLYLVKTEDGTHLVSNFVSKLCESHRKWMKPNTMLFNLVLDACVRFKLGFRGERFIELMARSGVVADGHTIIMISRIHEMNGQRDELTKYKVYIDRVSPQFVCHYRQFYDSLLNLHFKFNDIDSTTELMWEFFQYDESLRKSSERTFLVPIGSQNLKDVLKIQIQTELIQKDTVFKLEDRQELVIFRDGKFILTNKCIAKLVKAFKTVGNLSTLLKLLLKIQTELRSVRGLNLCCDLIEACVRLGWLELAHDILDGMEASNARASSTSYIWLLTAYFKGKRLKEAKGLLAQMRKPGMGMNLCDKFVVIDYLSNVNSSSTSTRISDLIEAFVQEMSDEKHEVPSMVYELNSSVRFFCKAKMIKDAMWAYQRFREIEVRPTTETFANLVSMFSSMEMYRDMNFLWRDMRRGIEHGELVVSGDLYEYLLICFIRGGYFKRVMEVIGYMEKHHMSTDKSICKSEYLKLHSKLYMKFKATKARSEAQRERLRYVLAFKNWASIKRSFRKKRITAHESS